MASEEVQAYKARNSGLPIFKFTTPDQIELATSHLFTKLKLITGISIGIGDLFNNVSEEIFSFLISNPAFRLFTLDEIILAFRMNAAGQLGEKRIEHYGQLINCDYIGKVLEQYIKVRQNIEDKMFLASEIKSEGPALPLPPMNEDEMINNAKYLYKTTRSVGLIMTIVYDILVKRELISLTVEQWDVLKNRIINQMENEALQGGLAGMRKLQNLKANPTNYEITVSAACKRYATAMYFDDELPKMAEEAKTEK